MDSFIVLRLFGGTLCKQSPLEGWLKDKPTIECLCKHASFQKTIRAELCLSEEVNSVLHHLLSGAIFQTHVNHVSFSGFVGVLI